MFFGDRLKKMRTDAGMTQAELGELIGVSERVVSDYETNDRFPQKAETLQKLSEVFHISIDLLVGNDEAFIQNWHKQAKAVLTDESLIWCHEQRCKKVVKSLQDNGFEAVYCESKKEAFENIISEARNAHSIGLGGSMTVQELQLIPDLAQMGKELLLRDLPWLSPDEQLAVRRRQLTCDLFLTGTNAVTLAGQLVNVDGIGNRVGAMTFGPQKVIVVAGRNKIVEDLDAALKRIKAIAAPANARRLNKNLPCAVTGFCSDCNSPERICRATVILDRRPSLSNIKVLIVNDDLGY